MIDQYRRYHENLELFVESTPVQWDNGSHLRLELPPRTGTGWMEMWQLHNGLTIGLFNYQLDQPLEGCYTDKTAPLGFRMSISGDLHFSIPAIEVEDTVRDGDLWMCGGSIGPLLYTQPAGCVTKGFSIELPPWMAKACLKNAAGRTDSTEGSLSRGPVFKKLSQGSFSFLNTFTRLLAIRKDTFCGRLQFESLVLDLLSRIFSLDFFAQTPASRTNPQMWSAIDEAVDILKQECEDPPTIPELAKRVAINECYLKAGFRHRAGMTIGEYVRKLRMEKALALIESNGCSIIEAALSVGYSNPSHFSAAFKKFYGCLPSRLLK